jgi:hypothetical protein
MIVAGRCSGPPRGVGLPVTRARLRRPATGCEDTVEWPPRALTGGGARVPRVGCG